MVAFIVMVRLAENKVNNHVGNDMVVKVMIQYKIPGTKGRTLRIADPKPRTSVSAAAAGPVMLVAGAVELRARATVVMMAKC